MTPFILTPPPRYDDVYWEAMRKLDNRQDLADECFPTVEQEFEEFDHLTKGLDDHLTQVLTHADFLKTMEANGFELLPCLSPKTSSIEDYCAAIDEFRRNQVDLDPVAKRVLYENLWELYE